MLQLNPPFVFYGQHMSSMYILENGLVTFSACDSCGIARDFTSEFQPLIAPFWHDTDGSYQGNVYYRLARDTDSLLGSQNYVLAELGESFNPSYVVVVTWEQVRGSLGNSTFQALFVSDGTRSFILFAYESIQAPGRFIAGYSYGDGRSFRYLGTEFTTTPDNLVSQSNVRNDRTQGRYIFRVDSKYVAMVI